MMRGGATQEQLSLCEQHTNQIQLNYTVETSDTEQPGLRRVGKVVKRLHTLSPQSEHTQTLSTKPKPRRRPTFDFTNLSSDEKSGAENEEETEPTATMSLSEKASNPKDKLEGTYQGRV